MIPEIEKNVESILGEKQQGKYIVDDNITLVVEEQNGGTYLWIEDRRGEKPFAWLFNIEKLENGYKFFSDKYEYIECDSLEKVIEVVKRRKY